MIPIKSVLTNYEEPFNEVSQQLHQLEFTLGGNWSYDHGYFDRYLDEAHQVWLRIPFEVTHGTLDGDTPATDAIICIGTPFVLKHVYNDGLDNEAQLNVTGALINQFQEPIDKDAPVEDKWVAVAKDMLDHVERAWKVN
ncbi:YugN-like family protein [Paenibacillus sp. 1_12]|uniref:YugN family protein n=1 Tax=Paenibacillus sp. 1_12 TaxID=1566278 RepID=UPI0008E1C33A|nr:YugN family protein [Paenibacillus sp. 1_12]SFL14465.1 YugN-like family protein [Paenibacillus sp. 1_12]